MVKKRTTWWYFLLGLFIPIIYVAIVKMNYLFVFAINDDIHLKNIVSGAFSGTPDGHMIHIRYPVSWLLQQLYRIASGFNWYGIFMIALHMLCLGLIIFRILECVKCIVGKVFFIFISLCLYSVCVFSELIRIQFTTTNAFVAATAIFWYLTMQKRNTIWGKMLENGVIVFLSGLVFCIRRDVLFSAGAMAAFVFLVISWKDILLCFKDKKAFFHAWGLVLAVALVLGEIICINRIVYRSEDWKNYLSFNTKRYQIFDYYGLPEYELNREFYDSLDMDKNEFQALQQCNMLVSGIEDPNVYDAIEIKVKELDHEENSFLEKLWSCLLQLKQSMSDKDVLPYHLIMLAFIAGLVAFSIKEKDKNNFFVTGVVFIIHFLLMGYLAWRGRMPFRAVFTVYIVTLLSYFGLFLCAWTKCEKKGNATKIALTVFALMLGVASVHPYRYYRENDRQIKPTMEMSQFIQKYFKEHPDNFYFIDTHTLSAFTGTVNLKEENPYQNYLRLGDWVSNAPLTNEKLEREELSDVESALLQPNVYIVSNDENDLGYLKRHYAEQYETFSYSITDVISYDEYHLYVYQYHLENPDYGELDSAKIEKVLGHVNPTSSAGAIDGDRGTCWTSGEPQKQGMTFDIFLTEREDVCGLRLDVFRYEDHPRNLRIFATPDGVNWKELEFTTENKLEFFFERTQAKQLRLILGETPETDWNWSIYELTLFTPPES